MEAAISQRGASRSSVAWRDSSDEAVVDRVLSGDVQAFEVLVRRYNQRLYRLARGILADDGEAREAVQESYLKAYLNLERLRGPGAFATWVCVITRNQAFSMLRARQRQREISMDIDAMEPLLDDSRSPDASDPAVAVETARLGQALESAIERLPDAFRVVFVLRMVEGMSVRETARILELNEKTVKTRLFRARRALREHLKRKLRGASTHVYEFAGQRCDLLTAAVMARVLDR